MSRNFHHSPKIETKNLKFYIDISNKKSFIPGSTILNSVVNGNLNLYNSPSYTKDSLIFNGTNQAAYGTHNILDLNKCTINLWIKFYPTTLNTPSYIPFWVSDNNGKMIFLYTAPNLNYVILSTENKNINKKVFFNANFNTNEWYNLSIIRNGNNFILYQNLNQDIFQETNEGYIGIWNIYDQSLSLGCGLFQGSPRSYCPIEIAKFYIYDIDYSNSDITKFYNVYKSKFNIS